MAAIDFKALAEEFKRTNWKEPGTWHAAPKLVVLLLILIGIPVAGYFVFNRTQFGALLKQLPNKSQMDALLVDINQAGLGRGLQFELFKPDANEIKREFYAELPIKVKVTGTYHDMGAFASDVGQLSRIVTLQNVQIAAEQTGNLTMEATARTFRYLDDDEVAEQRKAAAKKGPGKK